MRQLLITGKKTKLYKQGYIIMLLDAKIHYMLYICSQNYEKLKINLTDI